jgi:hypothetical protein
MGRFFSYIEAVQKQKKLTKTQLSLVIFCLILFLAIALILPNYIIKRQQIYKSEAAGTTYYVSATGDNNNSCAQATSTSTPKQNVQAGITCAAAGDIVTVRAGTYAEQVTLDKSDIIIKAYPGERPVIDGGNTRSYGFYSPSTANISNVTIDGFEIKQQTQIGIYVLGGIKQNFQIRNNYIHHVREKGIWINGGSNHLIENNEVFMVGLA